MSQTINLNPERLRELYWQNEMTLQEVADECGGVSNDTIRRRMAEHDIPRRSQEIDKPEKRLLVYFYWNEHRTTTEIAEQFGVSHVTVLRWMDEYDIPRREAGSERNEHEQ
jgi:DNA-directed RNA polymerase specialized sigma subunit